MSKPKALAKGDAVFQHVWTWHTSWINHTDKVRWGLSSIRFSGRPVYTGQWNANTNDLGLESNKLFDHPNFPTNYP